MSDAIFSTLERITAGPLDPYAGDLTTRVTVEIAGTEYPLITQYSLEGDVLNLGDPCAVEIPNPRGQYNGKINIGDSLKYYMANPFVLGGQKLLMMTGIVTNRRAYSNRNGTFVGVDGADLGWHLVNNDAPLWFRLRNTKWSQFLKKAIDSSWGFQGTRMENDSNRKLRLGRQDVVQQIQGSIDNFIPPIQVEVGDKVADLLILFARREKKLVNVSSDGYLQFWAPNYNNQALYQFHYHRPDEGDRSLKNNVESASLTQSIDGLYTNVMCIGTVVRPPDLTNSTNPNEGQFIGAFQTPPFVSLNAPLPFNRRMAFSDGDQLTAAQAAARAQWKFQRGQFDSYIYEIEVKGHAQGGAYYVEDTMAEVDDTVHGVQGQFYVSKVRKAGTRDRGTRSILTLRKPKLLAA